jgi:hypothetical protein
MTGRRRRWCLTAGALIALTLGLPSSASAVVTLGADLSTTPTSSAGCGNGCNFAQVQLLGANQAAPFDGVVVRWRVKGFSGPVKVRVIRPFGGDSFSFVSSGSVVSAPSTGIATFATQLPIKIGDYIGVELVSSASTFAFDSAGTRAQDRVATWTSTNPDGTSNMAVFGDGSRVYINGDVEPDADHDGFGDETQDVCPGAAGPNSGCPPLAPAPPIPPPLAAPDKTPPAVTASGASVHLSASGRISFSLLSNENATGTAGATITVPRHARAVRFASRNVSLSANVKTKVTLKLTNGNATAVRNALKKRQTLTTKSASRSRTRQGTPPRPSSARR